MILSRVWGLYLRNCFTLDSRKTTDESNTLQGQYLSLCSYGVVRLVKEGIITEIKEHTEGINSIIPVMKSNGSLRLWLDPKDLNKATSNPRLQRLLFTLAQYERGKDNVISDAFSQTRVQRLCDLSHQFGEDASTSPHTDCSYKYRKTTRNICEATFKDHILKFLAKIIHEGWSKTVPMVFIYSGTSEMNYMWWWHPVRLIMPQSERSSILRVMHEGHHAIDKINLRDRRTVYWPVISEDIKVTYHKCSFCACLQRLSKKRPCSL